MLNVQHAISFIPAKVMLYILCRLRLYCKGDQAHKQKERRICILFFRSKLRLGIWTSTSHR